ncbi:hypothetical protein NUK42_21925, partial [Aeromonas veronii]|uniref:hypothetical protein n=1 Tax=Aeromonas veronii TaxID=654 RepID=UPI00214F3722
MVSAKHSNPCLALESALAAAGCEGQHDDLRTLKVIDDSVLALAMLPERGLAHFGWGKATKGSWAVRRVVVVKEKCANRQP